MTLLTLTVLTWLTSSSAQALADVRTGPIDMSLAEMADRYCVGPDGDHRMTWMLAEQDGFVSLGPEDVPQSGIPGIQNDVLRGLRLRIEGTEFRLLTAANRVVAADQGTTYFRRCWVSSSRADRRRVDAEFQREFATRGFRVGPVRMFAWIPRPDGSLEPVSRRVYMRQGNELARTQGLRQLTTRQYEDGVFIGYASPRDEATYRGFDWRGPDPVPRPD